MSETMTFQCPWNEHIDHDSFGFLDLSGTSDGKIGCMLALQAELQRRQRILLQQLTQLHESEKIAFARLLDLCDAERL